MTAMISAGTEEGDIPDADVLLHLLEVVEKMDPGWAERELEFMPAALSSYRNARKHK